MLSLITLGVMETTFVRSYTTSPEAKSGRLAGLAIKGHLYYVTRTQFDIDNICKFLLFCCVVVGFIAGYFVNRYKENT